MFFSIFKSVIVSKYSEYWIIFDSMSIGNKCRLVLDGKILKLLIKVIKMVDKDDKSELIELFDFMIIIV